MKRYSFIMLFLAVCAFVQAQTPEQQIIDLSKKKFDWMIRMKVDSLQDVLDDRLMFVHSNGWSENKQEFIDDIKSGKLKYVNIEVSQSSARVYPATAIVTGTGKFTVMLDGKPLEINLFYTEVYILKNKKWLLASRHSNRMP